MRVEIWVPSGPLSGKYARILAPDTNTLTIVNRETLDNPVENQRPCHGTRPVTPDENCSHTVHLFPNGNSPIGRSCRSDIRRELDYLVATRLPCRYTFLSGC